MVNNNSAPRDFDAYVLDNEVAWSSDRANAMRVGDYMDLPSAKFKRWSGPVLAGKESSLPDREVRVSVLEIIDSPGAGGARKIVVEANGVQKEVYASLFFNVRRGHFDAQRYIDSLSPIGGGSVAGFSDPKGVERHVLGGRN